MKIKSIQSSGLADVYNMEVEETHSFSVMGGLIVHNCYDSWRYSLMSRPMVTPLPKPKKTKIQRHKERLQRGYENRRIRVL